MSSGQLLNLSDYAYSEDSLTVSARGYPIAALEIECVEVDTDGTERSTSIILDDDRVSALAAVLLAWISQHTPEHEPQHAEIPGQTTVDEALVAVSVAP